MGTSLPVTPVPVHLYWSGTRILAWRLYLLSAVGCSILFVVLKSWMNKHMKLCWRKRSPFTASAVNLFLSPVHCVFKENILWTLALWLLIQKNNTNNLNNSELQCALQLFWKYLTHMLLTDPTLKMSFWALSTKVFMLHGSWRCFTHTSSCIIPVSEVFYGRVTITKWTTVT
jgi:hypothetical protein